MYYHILTLIYKKKKKDMSPKKDFINIYLYVQAKTMKTSNQSF